jgi:hypothetical protein
VVLEHPPEPPQQRAMLIAQQQDEMIVIQPPIQMLPRANRPPAHGMTTEEIKAICDFYAGDEMAQAYKDMAIDKTPLHIRANRCVRDDARVAPGSFMFLFQQTLSTQDWSRIHTRANCQVLAAIAIGSMPYAHEFCNCRLTDGDDPQNKRLAGKVALAMKNASYHISIQCYNLNHIPA